MKKLSCMAVLVITVFALTTSCSGKDAKDKEKEKILAEINGTQITLKEFEQRLQQVPGMAHSGMDVEGQKKLLDNLVMRALLLQEAEKRGVDKDEDVMDKLKDLQERVVLDRFLEKEIEGKAAVTSEDVKAYYEKHPEEMKQGEEVHAAHILVKDQKEAEAALKKLKKGANFSTLASEISVDPGSKSRGGDLGFFPKGRMVPAFEEVAFRLKPGELSDLVQTQFGYHIIKVLEKRGGEQLSLEAAQPQIQQKLMQEKQKTMFDTLVADLKSKAKITLHEELLLSPSQPPVPPAPPASPAPENK